MPTNCIITRWKNSMYRW